MINNENYSSEYLKQKSNEQSENSLYVDSNGILSKINFSVEVDTKPHVDTVIISDVHLGSPVSRPHELIKLLDHYSFRQLILNGDIFDDLNFKRFRDEDWEFVRYLRFLSTDRLKKVIWIIGNHDGNADLLSNLIGVKIYQEYFWQYDGKTYLAIHGHQFDDFLYKHVIISNIASAIYHLIQKWGGESQKVSRYIKRASKSWLKLSNKIASRALNHAKINKADIIICGHTHQAIHKINGTTEYYNSGCWTDKPAHYITIDTINGITLNQI